MKPIALNKELQNKLVAKLQDYFEQELDQELGQFDAAFLMDFFAKEMGVHYYNHGIFDAQAAVSARLDEVSDVIFELERAVD